MSLARFLGLLLLAHVGITYYIGSAVLFGMSWAAGREVIAVLGAFLQGFLLAAVGTSVYRDRIR